MGVFAQKKTLKGAPIEDFRKYTPYSKMTAILLLFGLHVNKLSLPHFHFRILLHFVHVGEAKRANFHVNKEQTGCHFGIRRIGLFGTDDTFLIIIIDSV